MLITNFIDNLLFALIFYWYGKKLFTQVSSNKTDYVFLIAFVLLKTFAGIFHLTLVNFVFSILTYIGIIYLFFHDTLKKEIFFIKKFWIWSEVIMRVYNICIVYKRLKIYMFYFFSYHSCINLTKGKWHFSKCLFLMPKKKKCQVLNKAFV